MSVNKHEREKWCAETLEEAVKLFHVARLHPDNADEELAQVAVRCCNTAFQDRAHLITGDREKAAQEFGRVAFDRLNDEIFRVLTKTETEELVC